MGNFINPMYQKSQSIPMKLTYNTAPSTSASQTIVINDNTFIAHTITDTSLTQASGIVQTANMYTITFKPIIAISQSSRIIIQLPSEVSIATDPVFSV
jgi:hypothetical protein